MKEVVIIPEPSEVVALRNIKPNEDILLVKVKDINRYTGVIKQVGFKWKAFFDMSIYNMPAYSEDSLSNLIHVLNLNGYSVHSVNS